MGFGVNRAAVGAGHVEDPLVGLAILHPALDHLQALQWGRVAVAHGPDEEAGGGFAIGDQVAAHGHPGGVGGGDDVLRFEQGCVDAVAGEKAHRNVRAAGGEGLLAPEGIVDGLAGVALRPDRGQPGCAPVLGWGLGVAGAVPSRLFVGGGAAKDGGTADLSLLQGEGAAHFGRGVEQPGLAPVVVLLEGAGGVVGVGGADYAEAIGVDALGVFHR